MAKKIYPKINKNQPKVGLIGAGYWGKNLVRVFSELDVLKVVCDIDKKILAERKKEYPNIQITTDFSEILQDPEIKGVVISTPAVTHYNLAKKSLLAKKDTFVEKPLALKVRDGEKLIKLARERKKILMVGHLLLYHPAIKKLKKIIKSGKLGRIRYVWSNRLNFGKFRREENVLWSFSPHDIAVLIDFLGMPKNVRVMGKSYLQDNVADTVLSFFEFGKEKTAHIFGSWLNPFKEQKLTVIGSKKMMVFDGVKNELVMYPHKIKRNKNKNLEAIKNKGKIIKTLNKEPLLEEVKHFLECIKTRKKPITNGKEALLVLKVLDASQRSLVENKKIEIK